MRDRRVVLWGEEEGPGGEVEGRQADQPRGRRGPQGVTDMVEEVGARRHRCEIRGVGERRELVPEVGSGDDRSGGLPKWNVEALGDPDQGHSEGPHRAV